MDEDDEIIDEGNLFCGGSYTTHAPRESVTTETPIPGTDLVFCLKSVSYSNGKVKFKTSLKKWENGKGNDKKERIIFKHSYSLDVNQGDEEE